MQSIDTNVLVRLLVHDDEEQTSRAEALFLRALDAGGTSIAQIVLVETVWVLRSAYKFDRNSIVAALRKLLNTRGVVVEQEQQVLSALSAFETGGADFADYLVLTAARATQALPLWTFDERLARADGVELVP